MKRHQRCSAWRKDEVKTQRAICKPGSEASEEPSPPTPRVWATSLRNCEEGHFCVKDTQPVVVAIHRCTGIRRTVGMRVDEEGR